MKICMVFNKRTRFKWIRTLGRIRAMCHTQLKTPLRVSVEALPGGRKRGTIEY